MDQATLLNKVFLKKNIQQVRHNKEILTDLIFSTFPSDELSNLLSDLVKAMDGLLIKLNIYLDQLELGKTSIFIENEIKIHSNLISEIHRLYEFFEFSSNKNIPCSTLYFIEYLTKLISEQDLFTLIPTYLHTFRFIELSGFLKKIFKYSISDPYSLFPQDKKYTILMYPYAYKNMLFSNTLIGHEIGHYIELKNEIGRRLSQNIQYDQERIEKISEILILNQFPSIEEPRKIQNWNLVLGKTQNDITKILNNWMKELSCDSLAFKLIGPVYIISFIEYLLSGSIVTQGFEKHPPPLMRLRFLIKEYEESGFKDCIIKSGNINLIKFNDLLSQLLNNYKDIEINPDNLLSKPIDVNCMGEKMHYSYEIILNKFKDIQKEINSTSSEFDIFYDPNILIKEINVLYDCLNQLIIPCEIKRGVPANPISIINTGIIFKLIRMDELFNEYLNITDIKKYEFEYKINELIVKGLELCLIQKQCLPPQT